LQTHLTPPRRDSARGAGSFHPEDRTMGETNDKVKGNLKQAVGTVTGDDKLVAEGKRDVLKGKIKGAVKDVKKAIKDAVK
jgi:uncharacterized protein YjbJ (UPF0337 family)